MQAKSITVFLRQGTSLHPLLVRQIVKLLFLQKYNQSGAQVVFSTHNPTLLDHELLRRDQFWFTEKGNDEATHVYPLTDFSPRNSEALAKGYLAGRFGAIPFLEGGFSFEKGLK